MLSGLPPIADLQLGVRGGPALVVAMGLAAWVRHVDDRRALNAILGLAVRRNSGVICRTALAHKPPVIIASFAGGLLGLGPDHACTRGRCADGRHVHCARAQAGAGIAANGEH
jgi:hypothetical protein